MPIQALTFDVFGTVVDWRNGVAREGEALGRAHGLTGVDWPGLADAWRRLYRPTIDGVTSGQRPWASFDALQLEMLRQVLAESGITALSEDEQARFADVWRRLPAWPDVVDGLARLKRRFILATLSNGSLRQLVELARYAGLPWDAVLSVEFYGAYKPDPRVYRGAVGALQLPPEDVLMVAAHVYDLRAAREHGLRTAFIRRPLEWGPGGPVEQPEPGEFDYTAADLGDLARQLGC